MNISFDDLIPTPEGDAGGEAASAVAPLAGGRAPREAREAEPTEAQKKAAAEEWARGARARQTGLGAYGETFGRGVARAVPFSHQIGSAFDYALGTGVGEGQSSYEDTLRRQRAMSTVDDETRFKTGLAGQLVGGAALPTAGLAAQGVKGAAALGASYGALHGAAEGESLPDAAGKALVGGGLGGAFGAGVGAAAPYVAQAAGRVAEPVKQGLGVLYERLAPKAPDAAMAAAAAATKTGRDEIADAAARIGVDVPRFIASESRPVQQAAHVARNIPIAGKPVIEATRKLANDLGEAAAQRATNLGALSQHEAGAAARNAFDAWNVAQKQRIGAAYDAVDDLVDPAVTVPLRSTAALVAELAAARDAAAMNPTGGAAALVMPAISREEGLSYQGAKLLRTRLGEALDNPASLETANISQGELRRIYGALTDDIKSIVDAAGGPAAREALATANAMNASVSTLRERLQPLLAGASDESVIAKLASAARSTGRPDIELLTEAQRAISKSEGAWDAISGSVLASLGRDAEGVFSPQRFVTAYGKITPQAKAVLFPGQVGKDLDDIARVASRSAETYRQFGNPSGTGQTVAGAAGAMGLSTDPISTLTSLGGAALVARVLSRPAAISKAAQWAKAAEAAAAAAANGQPVSQKALTAKIIDFAKAAELPPDFVREAALRAAGAQAARIGAGPPPALPKVAGAEGGESDDNPSFAGTFGRAVKLGAQRAAHEVAQTATASVKGLEGVKDWQEPKDPAIDRISEQGWMSGITDPRWYAAKVGEGIGGSSPSIAGGVVGAGVGSAVAPGVGTVVGGAGGAAMMAAVQALAPAYARARATGMPHDAAVNVAMGETAISGTAGAAGAVAPFFRVAKGPISNLLAQLFVVQPGIGSAEQVARGAVSGRGITAEELIGGYVSNAGAGAAMHGGMSAAHRAFGRGAPPTPPSSLPGPSGPRPGNPPTPPAQPSPPSPNPAVRSAGVAAVDSALRAHEAGARAVADALAPPPLSSSGAASGAMAAGVRPPATVQATPNTFAAAIRQQAASSEVPGYDPRQVRPPAERGQPAGVFTFDAAALATDAQRFQYKADGDGQGVLSGGEGLKSVSKWDRTKAGQILVYEDHDGQTYVVDGHQRAGLARRIKDADPQAQTPITGLLLRSRDGITATQARTSAALKNIAEGSGTLVDAAKIFRDQPGALDDGSLARGRERIQDIEGLARLGPEAFGMVVNDVVPPAYGSLVGRIIPSDTARQDAAMRLLAKADPSTADEARALVRQVAQEDVTTTQEGDLFGGRDIAESLVLEKARVLAQAQRALGRERSTFGTLVKDATRIEGAGNTLAPNANAARRAEAEALATRIDAEAFRKGIVSDALSRAAEGHKAGWSARDAAERFVSAVRSGDVSSLDVDRPGSGGGERGAEVARPARPVRGEQPAGEVAPAAPAARAPASPPTIEASPAGPQTVIPGAEKAPGAKLAQIGADAPLKPKSPQKDTDGLPLMNDSSKQGDLVDAIKTAADVVKPPAEPQTKVGDQEPTLASQPSAEGAARDLWGDGRWKARVGDNVYQTVPGPFGMPASIRGTVEQGKGGLRVRVEAAGDALGIGQYRGRSTIPYDSAWTVVDDPEPGRRRKEQSDKEQAERDKFDAFIADELKKTSDDVEAAVASGHARLTAENAKPGLVVINYSYGDHRGERHYISHIGNDGTVYSSILGVDDEAPRSRGGYDAYSVPMPEQIVPLDEYGHERSKNHTGADAETGENISIRHMGKISERDAMRNVRWATRVGQYRVVRTKHKPWSVDDFFGSTMEEAEANARKSAEQAADKPAKQPERMLIGKNRDGHPLLQDDRGVRSYVVDGLRVTESVKLGPDGEPMVDEKTRHPDYLLPDEIEDASAGNGKDDNPPEMGKNGGKNSGADFSPPKTAEKPPAADAEPANPATGTKSDAVASPSAEPQPVAWADAKPGDKLASGETLIARGIRVKREAQEMAAKAPPGRVRGVIGDGVGRWAVTERDGVTGAKAWEARRADLVEQGRKAAEDGKGRDDFPSDLGQDARAAWREGWDARAAAKNAEAETAASKPPVMGLRFDPKASPADAVAAHLARGEGFSTIVQARKFIDENGGKGLSLKQVDEAIEHGVVKVARQIVASDPAPLAVYDKLVNLYNRQPRLGVRTSESVEQQAYSTPAPLAYIASRAAGIDATKTVYEPSAGNGMLLIGADPAKVKANELNGARAAVLRQQGFKVTQFDASKPGTARSAGTNDAVIANPPFGAVRDETGSVRRFDMSDIQRGYSTNEIDHVIALRSLGAMASDGRAVLILGSVAKTAQSPEARSDAYNGKAKREFFKTLYDGYNVVDHYTVSGDLYSRQGAAWPVDVVVIDGRGKSARRLPAADPPQIFDSWDQLKAKLDVQQLPDRRPSTPDAGEQPGEQTSGDGRGRPSGGDAGNRGGVGGLRRPVGGGEAERPAADVRPESDGEPIPVGGRGGADAEAGGSLPADREPAGSRPVASPDRGDSADGLTPPAISPESRPEPTQAPAAPAPAAIDDGATQTPYKPRATGAESFDVLTPENMRDATHGALDGLAKRVGDLTDYTAKAVGMDRAALTRVLMAEQIDALALAIDNVERGSAFIIGDQTGIGKGRVNAMMIRYAIKKGMTPIFVTEKPNLYGDMWRDLMDTNIEETLGRQPRILMTNSNQRVTVEVGGQELVLKPLDGGGAAHNAALADIMSGARAMDADAIFTTYSQMQSVKGGETVRRNFLRSVAPNSIVIFDESHNAGGQPKNDPRAQSAAKKKAEDRASLARWMAQAAKGVFFSSATFAKNPDVMDLYAKTDMRLAVKNVSELADVIRAGGVPLQEVISSMLARAGQYIRRERSFEGISYETPSVPFDRDAYNSFSRSLAAIHEFSKEVKESAKEIRSALKDQGNIISKDGAVGDSGVESTNFTSIMHNVINQMMLAAKADSAAEMAIAALRRGEKPVLTVSQTMESFLNHYAESAGVGIGMTLDGTFQDVLRRYLQRSREIRIKKGIGDAAEVEIHYLTNDELGPSGVASFERAQEAIKNVDVGDLPLSPIDHIRARIEKAGFSVGEITGRDLSIDYSGNEPKLASRGAAAKSTRARQRAIKDFNSGGLDVIILNRAGSTGLSLHAGKMFGDKRQRHMMLIQPEENIDTHMQVLGRVNRSGQVVLPKYSQLSLDVPAERRPAAVLAKKMASLNAATTSSRKGALESNETVDFMNVYGDAVAANWITENWTEARYLDVGRDEDANGSTIEGAMRKLTGRLPLLDVDRQEAVYASLTDAYNALLNDKIAAGENALEAQFMPLDARPVDKVIAVAGTEGGSPFAEPAYAETINVKRLRPATNGAQAKEALAAAVDARPTDDMATIRAKADKWHSYTTRSAVMAFEQYRSEVIRNIKDEDAVERAKASARANLDAWNDRAKLFRPGSYVTIEDGLGQRTGLVLSFKRETATTANPLALGGWVAKIVTPGEGVESISVSRITPDKNGEARTTARPANHQSDAEFMSLLDAMAKEGRQHRVVLTGNMLAAFARSNGKGQLIRYSTAAGERAQGILLPQSFKSAGDYVASQGKPITTVSGVIDAALASPQQTILSDDGAVSISQVQRGYKKQWVISVPMSKEAGGKYFLNPNLRNSAGGFSSRGGKMVAELGIADSIEKSIEWIMQIGATFTSRPKKRDKD